MAETQKLDDVEGRKREKEQWRWRVQMHCVDGKWENEDGEGDGACKQEVLG